MFRGSRAFDPAWLWQAFWVVVLLSFLLMPSSAKAATPMIAAGDYHSCALNSGGGVKCWGLNSAGQLGDGSTTNRLAPVDVSNLTSGVVAISAGGYHTCALTSSGGVKCWGDNPQGQLGISTSGAGIYKQLTPVDVSNLTSGVVAISAGFNHTCALTSGGGVMCWGNGVALGDGSNKSQATPVTVTGLASGAIAISSGYQYTCALTSSGGVKCWGNGTVGELGDGSNVARLTPVDVVGLSSGIKLVKTIYGHTCALTSGGSMKCWGMNNYSQLSDGSTTNRSTPVDVTGLSSGIIAIAGGWGHTCALTSSGGVKCWGLNNSSQLGNGSTVNRSTPVDVTTLTSGVIAIEDGYEHTCALTSGGEVKCWGLNNRGQLGDGSTMQRLSPVSVAGLSLGSNLASQTITFGTAPNVVIGSTGTVTAAASSGLAVTFSSTTPGICSISGSTVTGIAAGTCTIAANQAGNASYSAAAQVTQSFSIGSGNTQTTLSPSSASASASGLTGTISVTASAGITWTATSNAGWITITSGAMGSGNGTVVYTVAANTSTSSRSGTLTIAGLTFTVTQAGASGGNTTNPLLNPGFESGATSWSQTSSGGFNLILDSTEWTAHSGSYYAWLGGYSSATDVISQNVTIPADAQAAAIQFWYLIETKETGSSSIWDRMTVDLYSAGTKLTTLKTLSNLDATIGWVQSAQLDVSAYKGQTVQLRFTGTNNNANSTSFLIDDVSLVTTTQAVSTQVVEFYNTILDNYFITADMNEASQIGMGSAGPGWGRTGYTFKSGGTTPVCRFYGSQHPGPNSHFYTLAGPECDGLKQQQASTPATQKRWNFESLDFISTPPTNGTCPAGTQPVYRAYNNGHARGIDSNHRITSSAAAIQEVMSRGWSNEGVVMCAPL